MDFPGFSLILPLKNDFSRFFSPTTPGSPPPHRGLRPPERDDEAQETPSDGRRRHFRDAGSDGRMDGVLGQILVLVLVDCIGLGLVLVDWYWFDSPSMGLVGFALCCLVWVWMLEWGGLGFGWFGVVFGVSVRMLGVVLVGWFLVWDI